ncbi:hypothetical protein BGX23_009212 [Mortierella sp. AD031]|nr:hypothetical protein BGX23_009212 [Mortierella sp. AD031]
MKDTQHTSSQKTATLTASTPETIAPIQQMAKKSTPPPPTSNSKRQPPGLSAPKEKLDTVHTKTTTAHPPTYYALPSYCYDRYDPNDHKWDGDKELDVFLGMTATQPPTCFPFIGHHILEHDVLNLADPIESGIASFVKQQDRLAIDLYFPSLGDGLLDMVSNSSCRRSAFPGFERDTNYHVACLTRDPSTMPSVPPGIEQMHFSLYPSSPMIAGATEVSPFEQTSAYSSCTSSVYSSLASSPTLSNITSPGDYQQDQDSTSKHEKAASMTVIMTPEDILMVWAALTQQAVRPYTSLEMSEGIALGPSIALRRAALLSRLWRAQQAQA